MTELAAQVHVALAQAYCDLGQAELAVEHHKRAARTQTSPRPVAGGPPGEERERAAPSG